MDKARRRTYEDSILLINSHGTFDPVKFLGSRFSVWRGPVDGDGMTGDEDRDGRNFMIESIAFAHVKFETCLESGRSGIFGEEKLKRLKKRKVLCLGGDVFISLWLNYETTRDKSVLEWLRINRNIVYMDFFGLILRKEHDDLGAMRCVLALRYINNEWTWHVCWLAFEWMYIMPSIVLPMENDVFSLRSSYKESR